MDEATIAGIGAIIAAIGTVIAAVALVFIARSTRAAIRQADIVGRESERRSRPWVGITEIKYMPDDSVGVPLESLADRLSLKYSNFGSLPAGGLELTLSLKPAEPDADSLQLGDEMFPLGTLFPGEPASWYVVYSGQLVTWRLAGRKVRFDGSFRYAYGDARYVTEFVGSLNFDRSPQGSEETPIDWRHQSAR